MNSIDKTRQDKTRQDKVDSSNNNVKPVLIGGFGNLCNNNTQYHFQNRIYDSNAISCALATAFNPYYLIKVN